MKIFFLFFFFEKKKTQMLLWCNHFCTLVTKALKGCIMWKNKHIIQRIISCVFLVKKSRFFAHISQNKNKNK